VGVRHTAAAGSVIGGLLLSFATALPAEAVQYPQAAIVSADPADFTPNVLDNADQVNDPAQVQAIAQVGNLIVLGGTFHLVQEVNAPTPVTRNYLLAFDATTGVVSTSFVPALDGAIDALLPAGDGTSIYVTGSFNTVDGNPMASVTRLDLATGKITAGFQPPRFDGEIRDARLVHGQLVVAGNFATIGKTTRGQLASLNPTTGALTSFVSLRLSGPLNQGALKVIKIDVTPDGSKLLAIGNFSSVNGLARSQVLLLNTSGATATLSTWQTSFFGPGCSTAYDSYMRDLDISPDGTYAVISTTGAYSGPTSQCDTVTRWDLTTAASGLQPVWRNVTGGDTTYAVAITSAAVYTGGHFRWANNPYAADAAGEGAVPREGLAALDPLTGLPLTWNPGRARGVGVFAMLATSTGLWVGSDTDRVGGETHGKIAFFPLAGGLTPPANAVGSLPDDVYLLGPATNAPGDSSLSYGDGVDRQFWLGPGHTPEATDNPALGVSWSNARGSFLVDNTVYSPWSDGTLLARSFDGTTMGAPVSVPLYLNGTTDSRAFAYDVPSITGIFYADNRVYYTLAGDPTLYWRSFTPQSQVFGAVRNAIGATAAMLNPLRVASMFISGTTIYVADSSNGHLYAVTLTGATLAGPGAITGPATLVDSSIDWRSRGAFVWDGAPANHVNVLPTALATASCVGVTCSFDGAGSSDSDGHLVGFAWDFGDGATASGATATHTFSTAGTFTATLTVTDNAAGTGQATVVVNPSRSEYSAVGPCRVFDTRTGTGTCSGVASVSKRPLAAATSLSVKVTGVAGVPASATAVVLNVTAVNATAATFVTVYPHGQPLPLASNLNVATAAATANLVVVPIGAGGLVDFYNAHGTVNLIADVAGYFSPTSPAAYSAVSPCRLFDTRSGAGVCTGAVPVTPVPVGPGATLAVQVSGAATVPFDATAVVLNVTAVNATKPSYVTVYPSGSARPLASNVNVAAASPVANLVVVPIGAGGQVSFFNSAGTVNLVADVAGYFAPGSAAGYTPTVPCRIFDTRTGTGSCPGSATVSRAPIGPAGQIAVAVTGVDGVPSSATAVVLNVTAVDATAPTFATVYPDGDALPLVSSLSVNSSNPVPNQVIVPVGADGMIDFYNAHGTVDLIADIAGYFAP
jgi:PKD domain